METGFLLSSRKESLLCLFTPDTPKPKIGIRMRSEKPSFLKLSFRCLILGVALWLGEIPAFLMDLLRWGWLDQNRVPVMTKALGLLNALKHGMDVPATDGTIGGIPIINLVNQAALEVVVLTPDPAGITSYDARK